MGLSKLTGKLVELLIFLLVLLVLGNVKSRIFRKIISFNRNFN